MHSLLCGIVVNKNNFYIDNIFFLLPHASPLRCLSLINSMASSIKYEKEHNAMPISYRSPSPVFVLDMTKLWHYLIQSTLWRYSLAHWTLLVRIVRGGVCLWVPIVLLFFSSFFLLICSSEPICRIDLHFFIYFIASWRNIPRSKDHVATTNNSRKNYTPEQVLHSSTKPQYNEGNNSTYY